MIPSMSLCGGGEPAFPSLRRVKDRRAGAAECPVCLGPHDDEIHAATLSVRRWFRGQVMRGFAARALDQPEFLAMIDGLAEASRQFADLG
ncbi:MAG: hypothetical protein ABSC23_05150 [Bryobacteraceae bacterium]